MSWSTAFYCRRLLTSSVSTRLQTRPATRALVQPTSENDKRSLSDALVAVLVELIHGVAVRPESMAEIIELSNDLRELALAV